MVYPQQETKTSNVCETSPAVKTQVAVLGVVTPCSDVVEYQTFGGPCCLHFQGDLKPYLYSLYSSLLDGCISNKRYNSWNIVGYLYYSLAALDVELFLEYIYISKNNRG